MADERDSLANNSLKFKSPQPSSASSIDAGSQLKSNPEEKFRIRLAAEAYDEGSKAMKYQEYTTDETEDDDDDVNANRKPNGKASSSSSSSLCRCDQIASPVLIIVSVCLLVIVGFVLIAILLKIQLDKASRMCQSPDCVQTSGVMMSKMDLSADPCQDFYQYSCTAFTKDVMIPPDRVVWSTFNLMSQRNMAMMRQLFEADGISYRGKQSSAIQKTKQYYSVCMNLTTPETQGNTPMLQLIGKLGSWSLTSDQISGSWSKQTWNFEKNLAKIHSLGVGPFFSLDVAPDDKNSSVNIIQIDQSGLTFSDHHSYQGNDSAMFHGAYVQYFTEIVRLLGGDEIQAKTLVEKVWDLEKILAGAFLKPNERADVQALYNVKTIAEVQQLFGFRFNFSEYLRLFFGTPIPQTEKIIVRVPDYFHRLGILLNKLSDQTTADYMMWLMVQRMVPYMSTVYQLAQLRLKTTVYKVSSIAPRWEACVSRTTDALGFASGALYTDTYFSEQDKENVEVLYKKIVETFQLRIPSTDWMDAETKGRALDKVSGLTHKIGYPDFLLDPQKIDQRYDSLVVTESAFENVLNSETFGTDQMKGRRGKKPDRNEWFMTPAEVNAYYDPSRNQVVLPAGILNQPFIDRKFPKSLSFGALGFIIGHELTHGFDNSGRQYDKHGNMVDWWGNGSAEEFRRRSQCLVNEYNAFKVYDQNVDGVSTLGENIADNGGIQISLQAYEKWLKSHDGEDELLPGLNMTAIQQFFLSYAQVWCTYYTRQYAIQSVVTDAHSNAKYRVNGVLQNVPRFSEAFKCPSGSPMNPPQKCSLW